MARPDLQQRLAILERRKKVAARYIRGEPQWSIALAFEVTQQTISLDLKAIHTEWLAESKQEYDTIVAKQLAKVDAVEVAAWESYQRSCQNAEIKRDKRRGENPQETVTTTRRQAGDPRFLDVVLRCVERRCKILGVDAEPRRPDGEAPYKVYIGFDPKDVLCPEQPSEPNSPPNDAPTGQEAPPSP